MVRIDDIDLELTRRADERYSWVGDDVGSVRGEVAWTMGSPGRLGGRDPHADRADRRRPRTSGCTRQLDAYEGDERVFADSWRAVDPRDHV